MLIYTPSQDCYHAAFRSLQILEEHKDTPIDVDRIRILDFYLLFPAELVKLKFPRSLLSYRSEFKKNFAPYESIQNASRLFSQLQPLQMAALYALAARNLLDKDLLQKHRLVKRTQLPIEPTLLSALKKRTLQMGNLVYFLAHELEPIPFGGPGGLKDRSGLLEHRYDLISSESAS